MKQTHITMTNRSKTSMHQISHALLTTLGDTNPVLRKNIIDYVMSKTLGKDRNLDFLDPSVITLVDKVAFAAYSIEDEDVVMLRSSGWSDDAIYEIILSAAYGAGLARMQTINILLNKNLNYET